MLVSASPVSFRRVALGSPYAGSSRTFVTSRPGSLRSVCDHAVTTAQSAGRPNLGSGSTNWLFPAVCTGREFTDPLYELPRGRRPCYVQERRPLICARVLHADRELR